MVKKESPIRKKKRVESDRGGYVVEKPLCPIKIRSKGGKRHSKRPNFKKCIYMGAYSFFALFLSLASYNSSLEKQQ